MFQYQSDLIDLNENLLPKEENFSPTEDLLNLNETTPPNDDVNIKNEHIQNFFDDLLLEEVDGTLSDRNSTAFLNSTDHFVESPFSNKNFKKRMRNRCWNYFQQRNKHKKMITESILNDGNDIRPYADVEIEGEMYHGLLDSGANVSVLGYDCEKFLENISFKFYNCPSTIKTANGDGVRILGFARVSVKFNGIVRKMNLYMAPQLLLLQYTFYSFQIPVTVIVHISLQLV